MYYVKTRLCLLFCNCEFLALQTQIINRRLRSEWWIFREQRRKTELLSTNWTTKNLRNINSSPRSSVPRWGKCEINIIQFHFVRCCPSTGGRVVPSHNSLSRIIPLPGLYPRNHKRRAVRIRLQCFLIKNYPVAFCKLFITFVNMGKFLFSGLKSEM